MYVGVPVHCFYVSTCLLIQVWEDVCEHVHEQCCVSVYSIVCMHMFVCKCLGKAHMWTKVKCVCPEVYWVLGQICTHHLQYKLLLSHSIAFKRKWKWELSLMSDRKTRVCVCVCVRTLVCVCELGIGWRGYRSRLSAQLSHRQQGGGLMQHELFYLEWAGIWIDWLLKLLFLLELWGRGGMERGNQLLAVKACCQNRDDPPVQIKTTPFVSSTHLNAHRTTTNVRPHSDR